MASDADPAMADPQQLREWPDTIGAHTRGQELGAIPNGRTGIRVNSEPGDFMGDDAEATIVGSLRHPDGSLWYWVRWWQGLEVVLCPATKLKAKTP